MIDNILSERDVSLARCARWIDCSVFYGCRPLLRRSNIPRVPRDTCD